MRASFLPEIYLSIYLSTFAALAAFGSSLVALACALAPPAAFDARGVPLGHSNPVPVPPSRGSRSTPSERGHQAGARLAAQSVGKPPELPNACARADQCSGGGGVRAAPTRTHTHARACVRTRRRLARTKCAQYCACVVCFCACAWMRAGAPFKPDLLEAKCTGQAHLGANWSRRAAAPFPNPVAICTR